ncbi:MAG TPA: long-chain fatty acid--CoA ligase [Flavitalea sp.]|nr:long-chain fatty acid--CoA ligase [Flavitalea sp.]
MPEPQRLYDSLDAMLSLPEKPDLLAGKENGAWRKFSTSEVITLVDQLSAGLLDSGIGMGDGSEEGRSKVAVMSKNRPEWLILDLAVQKCGAVLTPVYPNININELEYVFNDASVKVVFVNDAGDYQKIISVRDRIPSLEHVYTFEDIGEPSYWRDLLIPVTPAFREQLREIDSRIKNSDLATIIYTSGTTGYPKGVMLSHNNILSNVLAAVPCLQVTVELRALSFLPLNHIFERMITYYYLQKYASIYYAESMETIADNLRDVKPNIFTTVPRLLEKVYDRIMQKGAELKGMKKKLFFWAHELATRYEINKNQGAWYNLQLKLANRLIFSKWREALGNRIIVIVSGGAACQVRLIRIFTAAKIPILEGYGLTETSPVICVNRYPEDTRMFGTVGRAMDNVEIKTAEDGEILCKGPNVMLGYYKNPALTNEVMVDGWFHTGDIGTIVGDGFLKITDRKKEMFKTSGGKYVAPLPVENKLKESMYIEQVMVIGADRKFVAALIVPSFPNLREWARANKINEPDNESLINNSAVVKFYHDLVDSFNNYFNHVEQVKKFQLLPREWTIDGGEMTPKLSLKRKVVMERNMAAIERIYG